MRPRTLRRAARGQSLVETAIGITLFVTIVAFGIHFAEIGFLSLKVQEAAISALWDGTAGKMHVIPVTYEPIAGDSMGDAAEDARARYADFNGLPTSGGAGITQVFTTGTGMTVECGMGSDVDFAGALMTQAVYRDNDGTWCRAQATLSAWRFPSSFLDDDAEGGLYQERNYRSSLTNFQVCSVGRPVAGGCPGRYAMLIDDWGLAGEAESPTCNIMGQDSMLPCTNLPYQAAVYGTYFPLGRAIPTSASDLVKAVLPLGDTPLPPMIFSSLGIGAMDMKENTFWMSAAGEEAINFIQMPPLKDPIDTMWPTSPGSLIGFTTAPYGMSYVERLANGNCFLGKECD